MKLPGFYEYLTNRKIDVPKYVHEWKFSILSHLLKNGKNFISKSQHDEIERYLKKGVVYVARETQTEVDWKMQ